MIRLDLPFSGVEHRSDLLGRDSRVLQDFLENDLVALPLRWGRPVVLGLVRNYERRNEKRLTVAAANVVAAAQRGQLKGRGLSNDSSGII